MAAKAAKVWELYRNRLVQLDREKSEVAAVWEEMQALCDHSKLPNRELGEEYADTCPDCGHVAYCYQIGGM